MALSKNTTIAPAIIPKTAQRKITIAREASNFQKRNVIVTGTAFWTENIETRNSAINRMMIVAIILSLLARIYSEGICSDYICFRLNYLLLAFAVRFLAVLPDAGFFPSRVAMRASTFLTRAITDFTLLSRRGFFPVALRE